MDHRNVSCFLFGKDRENTAGQNENLGELLSHTLTVSQTLR